MAEQVLIQFRADKALKQEGYSYLREMKQTPYIRPQTYETWKKRSFKKDISKRENMGYDESTDCYTCHAGKPSVCNKNSIERKAKVQVLFKVRQKQEQNPQKEILSLLLFTKEKEYRSITINQLFCNTPFILSLFFNSFISM